MCLLLMGCSEAVQHSVDPKNIEEVNITVEMDTTVVLTDVNVVEMDSLEKRIVEAGLVDVQSRNANIWVDLKYTTKDNFLNKDLYGALEKAYLQEDLAERLAIVQDSLTAIDSALHLLIYDAVRPRSVQWKMWRAMDSLPVEERIKFVSNPRNGSVHNYGCAVDLTICDNDTIPLDMGAGYDDLRKIAYPKYEKEFLKVGALTDEHLQNRLLLRKVMRYGSYTVLSTEWWHFNGLSRNVAKAKYKAIE